MRTGEKFVHDANGVLRSTLDLALTELPNDGRVMIVILYLVGHYPSAALPNAYMLVMFCLGCCDDPARVQDRGSRARGRCEGVRDQCGREGRDARGVRTSAGSGAHIWRLSLLTLTYLCRGCIVWRKFFAYPFHTALNAARF